MRKPVLGPEHNVLSGPMESERYPREVVVIDWSPRHNSYVAMMPELPDRPFAWGGSRLEAFLSLLAQLAE